MTLEHDGAVRLDRAALSILGDLDALADRQALGSGSGAARPRRNAHFPQLRELLREKAFFRGSAGNPAGIL